MGNSPQGYLDVAEAILRIMEACNCTRRQAKAKLQAALASGALTAYGDNAETGDVEVIPTQAFEYPQ